MSGETWFITGTSRGIGRGLVEALLQRPNTTIIAGVRNPSSPDAHSLSSLPKATGVTLIVIPHDAVREADSHAAVQAIQTEHGITHLDAVVANAGIADFTPTLDISTDKFHEQFTTNTLGPIYLFRAVQPLLAKAANPRFFVTSSILGSIATSQKLPVPVLAYGMSKAAVNYVIGKLHGEFSDITLVAIHPGLVRTDAWTEFAKQTGLPSISVDESVQGYLKQIDGATRETLGGKYIDFKGDVLPW